MLKFLLAGGGATGRGAAPLRAQLLHMEMAGSVMWGVGPLRRVGRLSPKRGDAQRGDARWRGDAGW